MFLWERSTVTRYFASSKARLPSPAKVPRPVCWFGFSLLAVLFLLEHWASAFAMLLCAATAFLLGGCFILSKWIPWRGAFLWIAAGALLGSLLCFGWTQWVYQPAADLAGSQQTVTAQVEEITPYSWGTRYRITVLHLSHSPIQGIQMQLDTDLPSQTISYGDKIEFTATLTLAEDDWQDYYRGRGVYLLAETDSDSPIAVVQNGSGFFPWLKQTRDQIGNQFEAHFSPDTAALLQGVLLGRTQSLSDRLEFAYQNTGAYHFIAVSGMHLTVISGLCYWLFRFFLGRRSRRIATLLVIWLFVLFTGCPASALRSGVMLTVLMLGGLFRQEGDGLISLSIAGIVIVLLQPFAALDLGFLMSFCATLGILTLSRPFLHQFSRAAQRMLDRHRQSGLFPLIRLMIQGIRWVISPFIVAFGANVMLLPLLVWNYGYYSLWSIPSSLLLAVVSTPLLWLGMGLLVCLGIGIAPMIFIVPIEWLANLLDRCLFSMASVPWMVLGAEDGSLQAWSILVFLLALLVAARPNRKMAAWCFTTAGATLILALTWITLSMQGQTGISFASDGYCTDTIIFRGRSAIVLAGREDGYLHQTTYQLLRRKGIWQLEALVILRDSWEDGSDYNWLLWGICPQQILVSPEHTQALAMDWGGKEAKPLTEDTVLLGEDFQISFSDSPTGWDAVLHWQENTLLLTGSKQSATTVHWDTLLLTGAVYPEYQGQGSVLVLTKPWQTESPPWCIPVYRDGGNIRLHAGQLEYWESG